GDMFFYVEGEGELLFTNNETNNQRLFGVPSRTPYVKDAFHAHIIGGDTSRGNPDRRGTKCCAWRRLVVPAGSSVRVLARLAPEPQHDPFADAEDLVARRRAEADAYYLAVQGPNLSEERRAIHRQASAGLIWSLQFYNFDVDVWLDGDATKPPDARL